MNPEQASRMTRAIEAIEHAQYMINEAYEKAESPEQENDLAESCLDLDEAKSKINTLLKK